MEDEKDISDSSSEISDSIADTEEQSLQDEPLDCTKSIYQPIVENISEESNTQNEPLDYSNSVDRTEFVTEAIKFASFMGQREDSPIEQENFALETVTIVQTPVAVEQVKSEEKLSQKSGSSNTGKSSESKEFKYDTTKDIPVDKNTESLSSGKNIIQKSSSQILDDFPTLIQQKFNLQEHSPHPDDSAIVDVASDDYITVEDFDELIIVNEASDDCKILDEESNKSEISSEVFLHTQTNFLKVSESTSEKVQHGDGKLRFPIIDFPALFQEQFKQNPHPDDSSIVDVASDDYITVEDSNEPIIVDEASDNCKILDEESNKSEISKLSESTSEEVQHGGRKPKTPSSPKKKWIKVFRKTSSGEGTLENNEGKTDQYIDTVKKHDHVEKDSLNQQSTSQCIASNETEQSTEENQRTSVLHRTLAREPLSKTRSLPRCELELETRIEKHFKSQQNEFEYLGDRQLTFESRQSNVPTISLHQGQSSIHQDIPLQNPPNRSRHNSAPSAVSAEYDSGNQRNQTTQENKFPLLLEALSTPPILKQSHSETVIKVKESSPIKAKISPRKTKRPISDSSEQTHREKLTELLNSPIKKRRPSIEAGVQQLEEHFEMETVTLQMERLSVQEVHEHLPIAPDIIQQSSSLQPLLTYTETQQSSRIVLQGTDTQSVSESHGSSTVTESVSRSSIEGTACAFQDEETSSLGDKQNEGSQSKSSKLLKPSSFQFSGHHVSEPLALDTIASEPLPSTSGINTRSISTQHPVIFPESQSTLSEFSTQDVDSSYSDTIPPESIPLNLVLSEQTDTATKFEKPKQPKD